MLSYGIDYFRISEVYNGVYNRLVCMIEEICCVEKGIQAAYPASSELIDSCIDNNDHSSEKIGFSLEIEKITDIEYCRKK